MNNLEDNENYKEYHRVLKWILIGGTLFTAGLLSILMYLMSTVSSGLHKIENCIISPKFKIQQSVVVKSSNLGKVNGRVVKIYKEKCTTLYDIQVQNFLLVNQPESVLEKE